VLNTIQGIQSHERIKDYKKYMESKQNSNYKTNKQNVGRKHVQISTNVMLKTFVMREIKI